MPSIPLASNQVRIIEQPSIIPESTCGAKGKCQSLEADDVAFARYLDRVLVKTGDVKKAKLSQISLSLIGFTSTLFKLHEHRL